jgi:hypothetical protein
LAPALECQWWCRVVPCITLSIDGGQRIIIGPKGRIQRSL